jgi:hypothetical protein
MDNDPKISAGQAASKQTKSWIYRQGKSERLTSAFRKHTTRSSDAVMLYLAIKAALSGVLIAIASTLAKRYPGFGALVASLPLVSVLGMIWLWNDKPDAENMAAHAGATFWYVLPSLPMFLLIPFLLRQGVGFWQALLAGCCLTIALYAAMTWIAPRFGLQL